MKYINPLTIGSIFRFIFANNLFLKSFRVRGFKQKASTLVGNVAKEVSKEIHLTNLAWDKLQNVKNRVSLIRDIA